MIDKCLIYPLGGPYAYANANRPAALSAQLSDPIDLDPTCGESYYTRIEAWLKHNDVANGWYLYLRPQTTKCTTKPFVCIFRVENNKMASITSEAPNLVTWKG